jgi:hypothetical protein
MVPGLVEQPSTTQSGSVEARGDRHVPRAGLRKEALRPPLVQEVTGLGHMSKLLITTIPVNSIFIGRSQKRGSLWTVGTSRLSLGRGESGNP